MEFPLRNKKEETTDSYSNFDDPGRNCAMWEKKKSVSIDYIYTAWFHLFNIHEIITEMENRLLVAGVREDGGDGMVLKRLCVLQQWYS